MLRNGWALWAKHLTLPLYPSSIQCFQMYVPNGVGAFGSTYKEIEDLDEGWNFFLTKTRWKYLDRPTHRCSAEMRYAIWKIILNHKLRKYLVGNQTLRPASWSLSRPSWAAVPTPWAETTGLPRTQPATLAITWPNLPTFPGCLMRQMTPGSLISLG